MSTIIDFAKIGGPVFVGRENGKEARRKFSVDKADSSGEPVILRIPEETYSVNSSFFLGMFSESIRKFGSSDQFFAHYPLQAPEAIRNAIVSIVDRALNERGVLSLG